MERNEEVKEMEIFFIHLAEKISLKLRHNKENRQGYGCSTLYTLTEEHKVAHGCFSLHGYQEKWYATHFLMHPYIQIQAKAHILKRLLEEANS